MTGSIHAEEQITDLCDLPLVPLIRSGDVIGKRLRASKVVVAAGSSDDVALASDLSGEASNRAGDCDDVNFVGLLYGEHEGWCH